MFHDVQKISDRPQDCIERVEQLESERVVFQAFLDLAMKKGAFTSAEFKEELLIARDIADYKKAHPEDDT